MSSSHEKPGCLSFLFPKKRPSNNQVSSSPNKIETIVTITPEPVSTPTLEAQEPRRTPAYSKTKSLLTPAELDFYLALRQTINPRNTVICPKVRMADILDIRDTDSFWAHFGKIKAKHIDFLICNAHSMKPIAAIELDDRSHNRPKRRSRDKFVNETFREVGLPLVRIRVKRQYDPVELRQEIDRQIKRAKEPATNRNDGDGWVELRTPPICPKCNIPMVERVATHGQHAGRRFWGCANYPSCREIKQIS